MTEWIDFVVYAALIVAVWFGLPTVSSRLTLPWLTDRNPDWLGAHPELAQKLARGRWFLWSCYGWGALSLAALLSFQLGVWPRALAASAQDTDKWEALKDINSTLLIVGGVFLLCCGALVQAWLHKEVPLAERRHATLERRSIDAFIPRWFRLATYTLVGLNVAAWLTVGALRLYSTPIFWMRLALVIGFSVCFFFLARLGVNRRPHVMDRIFPGYRRSEVRYGFAMQLIPPIGGAVRLYEEVANTRVVDVNRALHLGVAPLVIAGFVRFARLSHPRQGSGLAQPPQSARSSAT